jgi:predicted nucleotidyltransferase
MSFIKEIKENENLRKIFGKRELKIIEKQLMGVSLEPSEKTRLSRDIRKKFEVVKTLIPYSDEFGLKHGANIKEFIKEVVEVIKEHEWFWKIEKIILFGSLVEKRFHLFSDIDIAVKFKKDINEKEAFEFRRKILKNLSEKIDIQVYNILPEKIKKEIDKNGKIIFQRKN